MVDCPNCNSIDDYATQFAYILLLDKATGSVFAGLKLKFPSSGYDIVANTTIWCKAYLKQIDFSKFFAPTAMVFKRIGKEVTTVWDEVNLFIKKRVNTAGSFLDDIYNAQKAIVNQWKNTIATATNIRKGNFGEIASDAFLAEKNFQPLHTRLQSIDAPTRQGIDGVFKKGNEYFIVESKYSGTATLSTLTDGTKQMSDAWIRGNRRLIDAVGEAKAQDIIDAGYKRLLAEIAPDGSIVYKELDANASVLGLFNP